MSTETVQKIIIKAVTDEDYRELLFSEPDKALEGFELSDEEIASLKALERDQFNASIGELEERMSRAGIGLGSLSKQAGFNFEIFNKRFIIEDN
jgi:hypothetical protein